MPGWAAYELEEKIHFVTFDARFYVFWAKFIYSMLSTLLTIVGGNEK
jgi:hypothetical protein